MIARAIVVAVALSAVTLTGPLAAQKKPQVKEGTIKGTSVSDGKAMFQEYCTPCHGKSGKGDGPAAAALKTAPADLTRINSRNGGTFPEVKIDRYIAGLDEIAAHGSRDMPVWGPLFKSLPGGSEMTPLRVKNVREYLRSIQQ